MLTSIPILHAHYNAPKQQDFIGFTLSSQTQGEGNLESSCTPSIPETKRNKHTSSDVQKHTARQRPVTWLAIVIKNKNQILQWHLAIPPDIFVQEAQGEMLNTPLAHGVQHLTGAESPISRIRKISVHRKLSMHRGRQIQPRPSVMNSQRGKTR